MPSSTSLTTNSFTSSSSTSLTDRSRRPETKRRDLIYSLSINRAPTINSIRLTIKVLWRIAGSRISRVHHKISMITWILTRETSITRRASNTTTKITTIITSRMIIVRMILLDPRSRLILRKAATTARSRVWVMEIQTVTSNTSLRIPQSIKRVVHNLEATPSHSLVTRLVSLIRSSPPPTLLPRKFKAPQ